MDVEMASMQIWDSRQCSEQRNEKLLRVWGNQDIKKAIGKRLVPVPESAS